MSRIAELLTLGGLSLWREWARESGRSPENACAIESPALSLLQESFHPILRSSLRNLASTLG